ncbi:MAG: glycosyltransferase family 9 protein [Sedimentisphaerales bacterium]|nr:glycosyltransferase family 9 protein [Sedimentisphaerales bacterium]
MSQKNDILSLLNDQERHAATAARQALIIQPGAIGDCILTLPLAQYMKDTLDLGSVVFLSHIGHAGFFAGRTCIDGVKSIESLKLHRLFQSRREFDLEDGDPLLAAFAPYSWIVTFLGEHDSDFEHNLIYTAHCTHSAEVISLNLKHPDASSTHISSYYIDQFAAAHTPPLPTQEGGSRTAPTKPLLVATETDKLKGTRLLAAFDIDPTSQKVVVIAPGSGSVSKCWPIENYIAVAEQVIASGFKVLFLLGPAELERFPSAVIGQLREIAPCASGVSLTEVTQLLSVSHAFVGNDSGIAHLAGALGIRTITLFGPTQSDVYKPCGQNVQTLQIPPEEFFKISPSRQIQVAHLAVGGILKYRH